MTKRFIISTDPLSATQTADLKNAIDCAGWWHWLPNFWLVKDPTDTLSAEKIRDNIKTIAPNARCFVSEVDYKAWAALTKSSPQGKSMGDWLHNTWSKD